MLAEHCNRTERRAESAEREIIKIKLLTHLETRIGETFHAVIVGVEEFGLFAQLVELPIEGLLRVTSLADDYYYLEAETHTLIGRRSGRRFRLGDQLEVRVTRVDVDRRTLDIALASDPVVEPPPTRAWRDEVRQRKAVEVPQEPLRPRPKIPTRPKKAKRKRP